MTGEDGCSAASFDNFLAHLVEFGGTAGDEQHVRSHGGEAARNGFADSAGSASHDGNLRFQFIHNVPFDAATGLMAFPHDSIHRVWFKESAHCPFECELRIRMLFSFRITCIDNG